MVNVFESHQNQLLQDTFTRISYKVSFEPSRYQEFISCLTIQQQEKEYYEKKIEEIKLDQFQQQQLQQQQRQLKNNSGVSLGGGGDPSIYLANIYPISPNQQYLQPLSSTRQQLSLQEGIQNTNQQFSLPPHPPINYNSINNNNSVVNLQSISITKTEGIVTSEGNESYVQSPKAITDINEIEEDADYDLKYVEYIEKQNVELKNRIDLNQQMIENLEVDSNAQLQELEQKIQKIQNFLSEFNFVQEQQLVQQQNDTDQQNQ